MSISVTLTSRRVSYAILLTLREGTRNRQNRRPACTQRTRRWKAQKESDDPHPCSLSLSLSLSPEEWGSSGQRRSPKLGAPSPGIYIYAHFAMLRSSRSHFINCEESLVFSLREKGGRWRSTNRTLAARFLLDQGTCHRLRCQEQHLLRRIQCLNHHHQEDSVEERRSALHRRTSR